MSTNDPAGTHRFALRAALFYALLGGVWIVFSDQAAEWLTSDPKLLVFISMFKGLAFVAVTALVLWVLLLRGEGRQAAPAGENVEGMDSRARFPRLLMLLPGLLILVLTAAGVSHVLRQQENEGMAELRAIADLKARQLTDWLREREEDARFIAGTRHLGEDYQHWQTRKDAASGERLRRDLREFVKYTGFHSAQVLDARATQMIWDSEKPPGAIPAPVHAAAARVWSEGKPIRVGPYRDADDRLHLDYVVALPAASSGAVAVLHIDLSETLFRLLQTWPRASGSGEVVWFRRDGEEILFLNELRHRTDTAVRLRLSVRETQALAAQFLRGEVKLGQAVRGVDYRNTPVFGVIQAVPGGDGFVLAKVDEAELYTDAYQEVAWVLLAGLLALLALGVGFHLARQRRELAITEGVRHSQEERLRALRLLASIADSSAEAIFAKDLEGRYLLINREAARIIGKTVEEALNRDDTALFLPAQAEMLRANDHRVIAEDRVNTYEETFITAQGERTFLATKGPLHDDQGRVIGLFGVSRDITERRQVELALQRERDRNQRYLDTVQTIMVVFDSEGRVTMINRKGCDLLGYAEAELLGRNWFETCLPQPEGLEQVYPVFRRIMAGELDTTQYFENVVLCRDGRQRLIAWRNAYFSDDAGNIIGTLSSGEDISERKAAEDMLRRQTEELKNRNAELERFNRATVGRELDMIELKRRINALSRELGREVPYSQTMFDTPAAPEGES
ncbi:MAG: PAS domain S-box protein [Pseudomonadota bacterium]|nr:PAS domain S-box protein [Pseudomonadota bacterium]MDP1904087.1 PAS domain S-box protein [Pseudomonadota bacterium]MDP2354202.1 PAS domain S-box protein [Pseudomonadota bacterium]